MSADRWELTVAGLLGVPLPALPDLPGRRFVSADEPLPTDEREALLMSDESDVAVGRVLGLTRQRVHQLRQKLRQRDDDEGTDR